MEDEGTRTKGEGKAKKRKTISELVQEYFKKHPRQDIEHGPVVDWVEEKYVGLYGRKPRDPWRAIRRLWQEGWLIKVKKGVYRYDPELATRKELPDFPPEVKRAIFERDGYKCVVCGKGRKEGVEIHADHIIPLSAGGTNTVENGQTLCSQHNLLKKMYSQTEFGKKLVIKLYEEAVKQNDEKMMRFCCSIFDVYNRFDINSHIKRPNNRT